MASHASREPILWASGVLGLAALFVLIGLVTPRRAGPAVSRAQPVSNAAQSGIAPADEAAGAGEVSFVPLDPQPELVVQYVAMKFVPPFDSPEAVALLERLGGADPAVRGLAPANPTLDNMSIQRAIRAVPTAQREAVMGVIVYGGQQAGIGIEQTNTDPLTGVALGRRSLTALATVIALEGGRFAVTAELRDEEDSSALEVLGRRAGINLGRTGQADGALILEPGQPAAIRLPGAELHVVFLKVRTMASIPAQEASPSAPPPDGSPGSGG